MEASSSLSSRLIGAIFVEKGLVTAEQLERALQLQDETGERLGEIIVARFGVSRLELASVLAEQWAELERTEKAADAAAAAPPGDPSPQPAGDPEQPLPRKPIGEIFLERGFVSREELQAALDVQHTSGDRLGEILVERGALTRLDLASALAEQWSALQKLRPPAPAAPRPWQNGSPVTQPDQAAPAPAPAEDVAAAFVTLDERLRVVERAATASPWRDDLERTASELRAALGEMEQRLAAARGEEAVLGSLAGAVEELRARVEEPAARIEALERRLGEVPAAKALAGLESRLGELHLLVAGHADIDELRARLDELAARVAAPEPFDDIRAGVAALRARVDELASRVPSVEVVDELRGALAEVAAQAARVGEVAALVPAERVEELAGRVEELEEHVASAAPLSAVREEIRRVAEVAAGEQASLAQALLQRVEELRERAPRDEELAELRGLVDEIASRPTRDDALWERVEELAGRLQALAGAAEATEELQRALGSLDAAREAIGEQVSVAADALHRRIDGVEAGISSLDALDARIGGLEQRTETFVDRASLEEALAAREARLHEETAAQNRKIEALQAEVGSLAMRVDEMLGLRRLDVKAAREAHESLAARVDALHDLRADDLESAQIAAAELVARLDDVAVRAASGAAEAERALREELARIAARAEERDAAAVEGREALRLEIERVAASVGWRLERIEESLAADDREQLRCAATEIERRLDAQLRQADEQVRVTERALRKGLASLGARLAESESAYVEAGNALRRSIERLGAAVVEADERIEARDDVERFATAVSFLAFAPTDDGYRLVGVEGPPPIVGARVEVPGAEGELVVARVSASPLPLDARPCAYLEQP
ncbi:hypothetical protein Gocc_2013 [Gaiella occulta]|uniref:Uncharacterized protein n=1 Tax=Gaiella occulta TaxID=1002870 RepID=A0A7M2YY82_9ACTN|nr:hypothetical protein [Gaiella occulta]RDI74437.1 hypothetical protein Gocc_2013 [Gaiella occulta]